MPLFFAFAAVLFAPTSQPMHAAAMGLAPTAIPAPNASASEADDLRDARVEIGPAVLTIYGPRGEIVSVE